MQPKIKSGSIFIRATKVGQINREIERSIAGIFSGKAGATSDAVKHAQKRKDLLSPKAFKLKQSA